MRKHLLNFCFWKGRDRTQQQFWKLNELLVYGNIHYIANSLKYKSAKSDDTLACVLNCIFVLIIIIIIIARDVQAHIHVKLRM